jgi:hypothetical protein
MTILLTNSGLLKPQIKSPPRTNLVRWFRGDRYTADTSDRVGTWTDLSGNGGNVTQGTNGNKPTVARSVLNGQDALMFTRASSQVLTGSISINQPFTFVIVSKLISVGANFYVLIDTTGGTGTTVSVSYSNSTPAILGAFAGVGAATATVSYPNWAYLEANFNNTGALYVDGLLVGTATVGTRNFGSIQIGNGNFANQFFNGFIAEVIIYSALLTNQQRFQLAQYMNTRYGLLSLMSLHA